MIKKLQIFIITILVTVSVYGQNDISLSKTTNQIGIVLGGVQYQLRDDIIAPLRWDGLGFGGNLSYSFIGDKGRHDVDLGVLYATLSNRYNHKSRAAEVKLDYGYMRKIAGNESHKQLHLGGLILWNYCLEYYDNWDDSHFYWLNAYEIGPSIKWSYTIGDNHQLAMNGRFSIISLVSRPPKYRYYDTLKLNEIYLEQHEKMKLTTLNEYISIGLSGQYMYQVRRKFSIGLSCLMIYKTFSKPERISLITYALQLKVQFAIGKTQKGES